MICIYFGIRYHISLENMPPEKKVVIETLDSTFRNFIRWLNDMLFDQNKNAIESPRSSKPRHWSDAWTNHQHQEVFSTQLVKSLVSNKTNSGKSDSQQEMIKERKTDKSEHVIIAIPTKLTKMMSDENLRLGKFVYVPDEPSQLVTIFEEYKYEDTTESLSIETDSLMDRSPFKKEPVIDITRLLSPERTTFNEFRTEIRDDSVALLPTVLSPNSPTLKPTNKAYNSLLHRTYT